MPEKRAQRHWHDTENMDLPLVPDEKVTSDTPIASIAWTVRTANCLKNDNIGGLSPLSVLNAMTDAELLRIRLLGYKSLREIRRFLPPPPPKPASLAKNVVRHIKRGGLYRVLGEAEMQISTPGPFDPLWRHNKRCRHIFEGDRLVVYKDEAGKMWARFPDEFNDGRFEKVP